MNRISLAGLCFASIALVVIATALVISEARFRIALSGTDFRGQYTGAYMVRQGLLDRLYDIESQYRSQKEFLPELTKPDLMVYSYHPLVAVVLSPLGIFTFGNAYRVAFAINFILLLYLIRSPTSRLFVSRVSQEIFPHIYAVFAFFLPVWFALLQNQFTYLLFVIYYHLWNFLSKNNTFRAGIILSALLVKPHYIIVPAIVFFALQEWRLIKGLLVGASVTSLIAIMIVGLTGIKQYISFLATLSAAGDEFTIHTAAEPTLKGSFHALLQTDTLPAFALILYGILVIALIGRLIYLRRFVKENDASYGIWFASLMLITLITSPHTNYHDLTLVLFFPFFLIRYYSTKKNGSKIVSFPALRKATWYAMCFGMFLVTVLWLFFPPFAMVSMLFMVLGADRVIRTGHLYALTRRSIPAKKVRV